MSLMSPTLAVGSLPLVPPGKPRKKVFLDQESNPGHGSGRAESEPLDHEGVSRKQ